jgi:spermidine synthase
MKKTERLDEATAPDGTVLTFYRHDGDYFIRANGVELMSTRRHRSEERLAEVVCGPLGSTPGVTTLIGGLGLGFTLRAALAALASDARVTVVELVQKVIDWNNNPSYPLAASSLADPRVTVVRDDVARVLANSPGAFDAIMMDVDNGSEAFTATTNDALYDATGIAVALAALRPHGALAYWSDRDDPTFRRALERSGAVVDTQHAAIYPGASARHTLYIARLP